MASRTGRRRSVCVLGGSALAVALAGTGAARVAGSPTTSILLPTPTAFIDHPMTPGPNGTMWVALGQTKPARVVLLAPTGKIVRSIFTKTDVIEGLTTRSDGSVWFSWSNSTEVGRISRGGTVSRYRTGLKVSTSSNDGGGVVPAPGGGVWFDAGDGRIARIGPTGKLRFVIRPLGAYGSLLGSGVGGTPTWIGAVTPGQVAIVSSAGRVLRKVRTADSVYAGTASAIAPDGSLWFSEQDSHISRVTTAGVRTADVVKIGAYVYDMTFDRAGSLWFSADDNSVNHLEADGTVQRFGQNESPGQIVFDTRGAFWSQVENDRIDYTPGAPGPRCNVPDLYGLSESAARTKIERTGTCTVGTINGSGAVVWGQSPLPALYIDEGAPVDILLGTGGPGLNGTWQGPVSIEDVCYENGLRDIGWIETRTLRITAAAGGFDAVFAGTSTRFHSERRKGATYTFAATNGDTLAITLHAVQRRPTISIRMKHRTRGFCAPAIESSGDLLRTAAP
jgi:streptogramin lyase